MKKSSFITVVMFILFSLTSVTSVTFAGPPGPPPIMQNGTSASNPKPAVKNETSRKQASPEEIAAYMKKLENAQQRDHDMAVSFTNTSLTEYCRYSTSNLDKWLIENSDVVIDRKDF